MDDFEDFEFIDPSTPLIIHTPKKEEEESDEGEDKEEGKESKKKKKPKSKRQHYEPAPDINPDELQKFDTFLGEICDPPLYISSYGECFQMIKGILHHIIPYENRVYRYDNSKQGIKYIPKKEIIKYMKINKERLPDYTLINEDLIYSKNEDAIYHKLLYQEPLYQRSKEIDTKLMKQINSMKEIIPCECPTIPIQIPLVKDIRNKLHEYDYLYYNPITKKYFNIHTNHEYQLNEKQQYVLYQENKKIKLTEQLLNEALNHAINGTTFIDISEEKENTLILHQIGTCVNDFIYNMDTNELFELKTKRLLKQDKNKLYHSLDKKFSQRKLDQAIVNEEKYHLYMASKKEKPQ
jgi:hypothetical protein